MFRFDLRNLKILICIKYINFMIYSDKFRKNKNNPNFYTNKKLKIFSFQINIQVLNKKLILNLLNYIENIVAMSFL